MTAKEALLAQAPHWTEREAAVALRAVAHEHDTGEVVDEWGSISATARASTARAMRRLDAEEAAGGFSWEGHRAS
jgi:hypothetical protein